MRILSLITKMVQDGVAFTDLHITHGSRVSAHVPGGYLPVSDFDVTESDMEDVLNFADPAWKQKIEGDGSMDAAMTVKGAARLRGNFFRYGGGSKIGAVLRKLPIQPPMPEAIDLPFSLVSVIGSMPKGLVAITGPTGSGKSTTLAAIIEMLNRSKPLSIVTIERPIEYIFEPKKSVIIQREVPKDVSTFQLGVQAAKRQDPDVIMVGEIDSKEAMDAALIAACSGHLVFVTTHARSVQESCESMLSYYSDAEMAQKRALLASSLLAIQSQVLVPDADKKNFVLGYELLVFNNSTSAFTSAIRDGRTREFANLIDASQNNPYCIPLNERLAKLVADGRITRQDAMMVAHNKEDLSRRTIG